jgi:hemerythrin
VNYFVWDVEKYSVGHADLDQQHQQLLEIVNRLIEHVVLGKSDDFALTEILLELNSYAARHFETEERVLMAIDYPLIHEQKEAHGNYIAKLSQCMMQLEQGGVDFMRLLEFVRKWWEHHILTDDMAFKPLLEKGV